MEPKEATKGEVRTNNTLALNRTAMSQNGMQWVEAQIKMRFDSLESFALHLVSMGNALMASPEVQAERLGMDPRVLRALKYHPQWRKIMSQMIWREKIDYQREEKNISVMLGIIDNGEKDADRIMAAKWVDKKLGGEEQDKGGIEINVTYIPLAPTITPMLPDDEVIDAEFSYSSEKADTNTNSKDGDRGQRHAPSVSSNEGLPNAVNQSDRVIKGTQHGESVRQPEHKNADGRPAGTLSASGESPSFVPKFKKPLSRREQIQRGLDTDSKDSSRQLPKEYANTDSVERSRYVPRGLKFTRYDEGEDDTED